MVSSFPKLQSAFSKRGNDYTLNPFKCRHALSTCISHFHDCNFESEIDDGVSSISAP